MKPEEFNRKCAEFMNIFCVIKYECLWMADHNGNDVIYNPYHNANDRNKVIEKMGISTNFRSAKILNDWCCYISSGNLFVDKSMEAAQIACIEQVLEIIK